MKNKVIVIIMALLLTFAFVMPYSTAAEVFAAETSASEQSTVVKVTGGSVYVRSGPGAGNSKLGVVYKGNTFTYLGEQKVSNGRIWYKIQYGSKEGWITSRYSDKVGLSSDNSGGSTGSNSGTSTGDYVTITGSAVNVRTGAGISNNKIGVVYKGNSYKYLGEDKASNGVLWYKIQYTSDTEGWVCGAYSKRSGSSNSGSNSYTPPPADGSTVKVTGSAVNVRTGAGVGNSKIGLAYRGNTYKYLDIKIVNGVAWYQIQFSDSKTGWICGRYCEIIAPAGSSDNGSSNNGSSDNGSSDNGSTDNGSTDNGSTDNGSTDNGSTDSGSTDNGSTDNGGTDNGSSDNGDTDSGESGSSDSGDSSENWADSAALNSAIDSVREYVGRDTRIAWDEDISIDQSTNDSIKTTVKANDYDDQTAFENALIQLVGSKADEFTTVNGAITGEGDDLAVTLCFVK